MRRGHFVAIAGIATAGVLLVVLWPRVVVGARMVGMRLGPAKTVAERVEEHGPAVRDRLAPLFEAVGVSWPPRRVLIVAFKEERRVELFASDGEDGANGARHRSPEYRRPEPGTLRAIPLRIDEGLRLVARWPVLAASGVVGPKLREGDRQVPEGLYPIESLNPMSRFHLALRVGYPNDFDRARAAEDGRSDLGGDIMVHGSNASVGCLAMGDEVAEDLFVLTALAGVENVSILIAPCDLRTKPDAAPPAGSSSWTGELWREIRAALETLPPR